MTNQLAANSVLKAGMIDRMACFIVLLCLLLLGSRQMLAHFQNPVMYLAYRAVLELVCVIVLIRLIDASVVRDVIDIAIYGLLFKMLLMWAYLFSRDVYVALHDTPSYLFNVATYMLTLMRLIWVQKVGGAFFWSDWPSIGLCGLLQGQGTRSDVTTPWQYIFAAAIISVQLAIITRGHDTNWEIVAPACAGLLLVLIYGHSFKTSVVQSLTQQQQDAKTIEQLQKVIINAHQAIKYLQEQQDPGAYDSADQTDTADQFDPADPSEPPDPSKPSGPSHKHLRRVK